MSSTGLRVFVPLPIEPFRRQTMPLLKPFFNKNGEKKRLGEKNWPFITFVDTMVDADYLVLPMSWNYYLNKGAMDEVRGVIDKAKQLGKEVLSFQTGDYGVKIPEFTNVLVLRANGHRSRLGDWHQGLPAFISDPVRLYVKDALWKPSPFTEKPKIGFCGMANTSYSYAAEELKRILLRNAKYYLGFTKNLPQEVIPTTYRRAQLLEMMRKQETMDTHFIYRKQYQAGAQTDEDRKKAAEEFYTNIWENQYVLCFRGAGNFSVRLYETLAMGRIPIFVNTDCILPLYKSIPWKEHVVWIEYEERHGIVDKVLQFHAKHTPDSFAALQERNRNLWKYTLTLEGFFRHLLD